MVKYVTTNIRLPKETYRELKQRALDAEKSLAEVVRESVAQYLVTPAVQRSAPAAMVHTARQESARVVAGAGPVPTDVAGALDTRAQQSAAVMIPEEILLSAHITAAELLQELALLLFQQKKLTLGQASRLVGMSQLQFQHLLASRRLPVHYDVADFEADLRTLREMGRL
jgi:predicted HTH domain antitoxin